MGEKNLLYNLKENLFIWLIATFVIMIFCFIFNSLWLKEKNNKIDYISFSWWLKENSNTIINNFKLLTSNTELSNLILVYWSEMNILLEEYQTDLKNKVWITNLSELFLDDKDSKNKEKIFDTIYKLNTLKELSKNHLSKKDIIIKKYSDLKNTFNSLWINILHENENMVFSSQELFIDIAIEFYTYVLSIQDSIVMENDLIIWIKWEVNNNKYNNYVELLNKNYEIFEQNNNNLINSKNIYENLIKNISD